MMFVHHDDCPKCHGSGSWIEQVCDGDVWRITYHLYCNCFKHMAESRPISTGKDKTE